MSCCWLDQKPDLTPSERCRWWNSINFSMLSNDSHTQMRSHNAVHWVKSPCVAFAVRTIDNVCSAQRGLARFQTNALLFDWIGLISRGEWSILPRNGKATATVLGKCDYAMPIGEHSAMNDHCSLWAFRSGLSDRKIVFFSAVFIEQQTLFVDTHLSQYWRVDPGAC